MNGRIYDAKLGRFLQADPFIQSPMNTQSMNRYAYTLNNPLNATDPTGYFFKKLIKIVAVAVLTYVTAGIASGYLMAAGFATTTTALTGITVGLSTTGSILAGAIAGFVGGFSAAALSGAGFKDAIKAGGYGALSGAIFGGIGALDIGSTARIGAHAIAGGALSDLQGGKFGHGFVSAGLTKALDVNNLVGTGKSLRPARIAVAAVLGGTISKATGGKFANGATTAAFAQAFNGEKQAEKAEKAAPFSERFEKITGMSVEDSIALYEAQTGESLSVDQVEKMFTDPQYAKEQLLANENLHKIYRNEILNSNAPQTIADAQERGYTRLPAYKSVFHNPWYNPWQNSKWVGPSGNMEVVFNSSGGVVSDIRYKGTFNFFGPDRASAHWAADVDPYDKWGN